MATVFHSAAYRFAPLENLKQLRKRLFEVCREWGLKGTILLSNEGINLSVAGPSLEIDKLFDLLRTVPGLEALEPRVRGGLGSTVPRMLVKIKKEIIAFGAQGIDPGRRPTPRLGARELKQWIDERRPLTLLDVRNNFEVNLGSFHNAVPIGIRRFTDFLNAVDKLQAFDRRRSIVTFCTSGIRSEKAAAYLSQRGFESAFQLDGGILKYLEQCGGDHFHGVCFEFDEINGLTADLETTNRWFCHACKRVLTSEERADPRTIEGLSCLHCHETSDERRALEISEHRETLRLVTNPLPGSLPSDNYRPLKIHARHDGLPFLDFLCDVLGHIPRQDWQAHCASGDIVDGQRRPVVASHTVRLGDCYFTRERLQIEPDVNPAIDILYEDDALIVIDKPSPLPTHPSGRYHRNSLEWILRKVYAPQKPRPAHRLDANTSGVVVFTRTAEFARALQPQFEKGEVHKRYLATVLGRPPEDLFVCDAAISAAGRFGARIVDAAGLASRTEFEALERYSDGTTLLLVTPRTGRTNQIRVHLWHLGWPIVGDQLYRPDQQLGDVQTIDVGDAPLRLHAWSLTFTHPQNGGRVTFETRKPDWARLIESTRIER